MNQGRIWCVVNPTVGLPLLLGSVALTSLAVHTAVLTHTTWYGNSYQGSARRAPAVSLNDTASPTTAQPAFTISVAPVTAQSGKLASFVVTVAPNQQPAALAANATTSAAKPITLAQAK